MSYGQESYVMDDGAIRRQLMKTLGKFEEVLKLRAAFYVKTAELISEMCETRKALIRAMDRNVTQKAGVFGLEEFCAPAEGTQVKPGFDKWSAMLSGGMVEAARRDLKEYLDFYAGSGKLDDAFLWKFYLEFNRMFDTVTDDAAIRLYDIFPGRKDQWHTARPIHRWVI